MKRHKKPALTKEEHEHCAALLWIMQVAAREALNIYWQRSGVGVSSKLSKRLERLAFSGRDIDQIKNIGDNLYFEDCRWNDQEATFSPYYRVEERIEIPQDFLAWITRYKETLHV